MKRTYLFILFVCGIFCLYGQQYIYNNLEDLLGGCCKEVEGLVVEKRTKKHISLYTGADYRIIKPESDPMNKYLRHKCYAVQSGSLFYINCKPLRYKKLRFGGWYAPAMIINGNVFFKAIPLGSVAAHTSKTAKVKLGGELGDAIASSSLISKRVYYMIEGNSGHVYFVGKDLMLDLFKESPEIYQSYADENSESAETTEKYLLLLSDYRE